jgi:hypothetical protein
MVLPVVSVGVVDEDSVDVADRLPPVDLQRHLDGGHAVPCPKAGSVPAVAAAVSVEISSMVNPWDVTTWSSWRRTPQPSR